MTTRASERESSTPSTTSSFLSTARSGLACGVSGRTAVASTLTTTWLTRAITSRTPETATVAAGGLMVGDATPQWALLPPGSPSDVLTSTGSLVEWQSGSAAGLAPLDPQYVVLAADAVLSNERVLTAGSGVGLTDGVAGGNAEVSLNYAAPAFTLDTANAAGTAGSPVMSDAQIALFDATNPTTIQPDAMAAPGSAGVAARRDHAHAIVCAAPSTDLSATTTNQEGSGTSFARADHTHAITATSDGASNHDTLLQSNASGQLTVDDLFVPGGGQVGISANERLVFNTAGNIAVTGADLSLPTGLGITHADGVAAGQFLRANGTRYVPATLDVADLTDLAYAAPGLTLGTANAEGAANSVMRTDATIAIFDATNPTQIDAGDTGAPGTAGVAARRDHGHAVYSTSDGQTNVNTLLQSDANGRLRLAALGVGAAAAADNRVLVYRDDSFSTAYNATTDNILLVRNVTVGSGVVLGSIGFSQAGNPGTERDAAIAAIQTGSDGNEVGLVFYTHPTAPGADPIVEAVRIDHDGQVGIGTSPSYPLDMAGAGTIARFGDGSGQAQIIVNGVAGGVRDVVLSTAGVARWVLRANETAEGGSNAGSDFVLVARTDAGAYLSSPLLIKRSTGNVGIGGVSIPGAVLHVRQSTTSGPTLYVYRNLASGSTDSALLSVVNDHASDDQATVSVRQDGTGDQAVFYDGASLTFSIKNAGALQWPALGGNPVRIAHDTTGDGFAVYEDVTGWKGLLSVAWNSGNPLNIVLDFNNLATAAQIDSNAPLKIATTGSDNITLEPGGYVILDSSKTTTGNPTAVEGLIYWNTVDNAIRMYADGGWRTLITW